MILILMDIVLMLSISWWIGQARVKFRYILTVLLTLLGVTLLLFPLSVQGSQVAFGFLLICFLILNILTVKLGETA